MAAVLLPLSALAGTEAGRMEVSGQFAIMAQTSGDNSGEATFVGAVGLGYFATEALEIKVSGVVMGMTGTEAGVSGGVIAGPDYHFNTQGNLVPYVGVYGGMFFGGGETAGMVDGHVGLKHFVGERTAITYQVSYQHLFFDGGDMGQVVGTIGLAYLF